MNCKHEHKKDFSCYSFGDRKIIEHEYCPECKGHWFKGGVFWTKEEWEKWINDDLDTGSQDKGFNEVETLGEAKEIFAKHAPPYIDIVQNRFAKQRRWGLEGGYDLGVHQYFIDKDGDELGYYTPIMQTIMIFAIPRKVGIKQDLISVL